MELTNFLLTLLAGFTGTVAMTVVMYLYASFTNENTRVVHVLGGMVTGDIIIHAKRKHRVLITGAICHISVGVLFSLSYFLLWNWGVFAITLVDSVIVGALSGLVAIIVWRLYLLVHQSTPAISLKHYFIALFISHIVFGVVTVNIYMVITESPQFYFQLRQEVNSKALSSHLFSKYH